MSWVIGGVSTVLNRSLPFKQPQHQCKHPNLCSKKLPCLPGDWFNIKTPSYQHRKSHCGDRRSYDRLISTMGFPILVRQHFYIESRPRWLYTINDIFLYGTPALCCALLYAVVWAHDKKEGELWGQWYSNKVRFLINPLRAKFSRENINIYMYLNFVSYLHIDTIQVVEILP